MIFTHFSILCALCAHTMERKDDMIVVVFVGVVFLFLGFYREMKGE